jgi:hypothetical protein
MFYLKHLKRISNIVLILFLFVFGCTEKKSDNKVVAKVNDSELTEEELNLFLGNKKHNNKLREEFIRNWIESEILFLEAKEQGITNSETYKAYLKTSQKELAVGLLTKKFFDDYSQNTQESELLRYYNKNKNEFKLSCDNYLISLLKFDSFYEAESFRLKVDETNWNSLAKEIVRQKKAKQIFDNELVTEYNIFPTIIKNYLDGMNNNEISIVINISNNQAYIAKFIKKYYMNDVPEFKSIKKIVETRYLGQKKELAYKSYISDLYSKYEIKK